MGVEDIAMYKTFIKNIPLNFQILFRTMECFVIILEWSEKAGDFNTVLTLSQFTLYRSKK